MAAVSTNYGTAGDSTLESSASRSRKDGSKSGSGSGSGSNENSRNSRTRSSHSRVQRKRAGTANKSSIGNSGPGSAKNTNLRDVHAHGALSDDILLEDTDTSTSTRSERIPMRASMFPLGTRSLPRLEKGRHGHSVTDSDLIELVPRPPIRHESASGHTRESGEDRMIIRKEVRYSIQYEDEVPRRVEGKAHDVSAYV